jgi:hypothetical protein
MLLDLKFKMVTLTGVELLMKSGNNTDGGRLLKKHVLQTPLII